MKMKAEDGKLYAEITLRDVVEKNDVSDMPLLAEVKRLYDENAKLRELVCDMLVDEERGHNDELTFDEHVERASELGVEFYA